jgi:hypothetical protein
MIIDARVEMDLGGWIFIPRLEWDIGHHEEFQNGQKNKIHIWEVYFTVMERFWNFQHRIRSFWKVL